VSDIVRAIKIADQRTCVTRPTTRIATLTGMLAAHWILIDIGDLPGHTRCVWSALDFTAYDMGCLYVGCVTEPLQARPAAGHRA
jgi:hypothetical protein